MSRGAFLIGLVMCLSACGYQMVSPEDSLHVQSLSDARVEVFDNQSVEPGLGAACSVALRRQLGIASSTDPGAALVFEGEVLSVQTQATAPAKEGASLEAEVSLRVRVWGHRGKDLVYEGRPVMVRRVYQAFGSPVAVNTERRRASIEACEEAMMVVAQDVHIGLGSVSQP